MKHAIRLVSALFVLATAGCVTEGESLSEPSSPEEAARANMNVGIGYLEESRPDLAIPRLERAVELAPRFADAQRTLAVAYDMTGEIELAEQHHRRAAQLAPSEPNTQNGFAVFLCRQNRWSDARPYFQRALDNVGRGDPVPITNNAGTCAAAADDLEGAETYFRSTLAVDAANVAALRGMIDVSIRSENLLPGRAFFQRLERTITPQDQDLLACYRIEMGLGDVPAAQECADRLQRDYPRSPAIDQLRNLQANAN